MNNTIRYLFIFFILIIFSLKLYSQENYYNKDIEIRYLKDKVDVALGKSFFNILLIKNNSNSEKTFNVQINTPKGWELIGNSFEQITLQPMGSLNLPVRVAIAKDAKGGVAYALVAIITDINGVILDNVYSFVNIPVESKIEIVTSKQSKYIDHKTLSSAFSVQLKNTGNIDEIINVKMVADNSIYFEETEENVLIEDILVASKTEEIKTYEVKLKKDIDVKKFKYHRINLTFNMQDTIINKSVWFNYLDWKFDNIYVNTIKPLNLELTAYDILGADRIKYRIHTFGKILLKKNREIYYSLHNQNQYEQGNNLWKNSYTEFVYKAPKTTVTLGDFHKQYEQSNFGRGISFSQKINENFKVSGLYTRNLLRPVDNYGGAFEYNSNKIFSFELGGASSNEITQNSKSYLAYSGLTTHIFKKTISLLYANSLTNYNLTNSNLSTKGWSYNASFNGKLFNTTVNINSRYGSPYYSGYIKGRMFTNATSYTELSKKSNLNLSYFLSNYRPQYFVDEAVYSDRFNNMQKLEITYNRYLKDNFSLFAGPVLDQQKTNNFTSLNPESVFNTYSYQGQFGIRYNQPYYHNSVQVSALYGLTQINKYSELINDSPVIINTNNLLFKIGELRFGFKKNNFHLHIVYHFGPFNIIQQFSYFYTSYFPKSIHIIPAYEQYFFNKKVRFSATGIVISNLTSKNNSFNLNSTIDWEIGKGWNIKLLNSSSVQQSKFGNGSNYYSSSYFELRILKSFNINHPRIKFYNYKTVYYKDLNGNRIHDANEPGISQVLSDIKRANPEADTKNPNYNNEFYTNDLISNSEGFIEYNNIPEGEYILKYSPQNLNIGTFETEYVEREFKIDKDTVFHIPFIERNKLFGKINLNRTKHSALGDIPLDNIKIIVEGNEKTYSTLTDKEGNFELYIPVADYYKVRITNIFKEHFNLRQEYYIVKFNGYKQFEISFEFDEKDRKIEFDPNDFLIDDDVTDNNFSFDDIKIIKQTNLRGVVKDANSLIPLHATVSIFKNNTNDLISETASSKRTGVYFTSFFAGEDYSIKAETEGYWTYRANLNINQVTTFENVTHDILIKKINLDDEIKTDNLKFNSEKSNLSPLAMAELDNILSMFFANPSVHIEISGHTDNVEALLVSPLELSKARASAVASYLVKNGLDEKRIKIKVLGNTSPATLDDSETGRARNRRVELRVAAY